MMKIRKAKEKAKLLVKDGVFLIKRTLNYEYWSVRGNSQKSYSVIYDIGYKVYSCTCKNIRNVDCSHIGAVKLFKQN